MNIEQQRRDRAEGSLLDAYDELDTYQRHYVRTDKDNKDDYHQFHHTLDTIMKAIRTLRGRTAAGESQQTWPPGEEQNDIPF